MKPFMTTFVIPFACFVGCSEGRYDELLKEAELRRLREEKIILKREIREQANHCKECRKLYEKVKNL